MHKTNYIIGIESEHKASSFLENKGYVLIKSRYKTKYGEIDLLMRDNEQVLIFVEVKARKNIYDAHFAISKRQQERIYNAAQIIMQEMEFPSNTECRFDAILISNEQIIHYKNILQ